jgi:prolyl 4-hydroxylase
LADYRVKDQVVMNMTMKALSCAPRVFEIPNFLSQAEVDHILQIAGGIDLAESTTGDVGQTSKKVSGEDEKMRKTRTSKNTWVTREQSPIIDAIYRRSADLLRIDESLLRYRDKSERPEMPTQNGIAESLQLVHYDPKQEVSLSCL